MLRVELCLFLYVNYWKVLFKAEELIVYNQAMFFCYYFQIVALKTLTEWTRLEYEEKFCCVLKQLMHFTHGKNMPMWM